MATQPIIWPEPNVLFEWIGEADISRDQNALVVAVTGTEMHKSYARWYEIHQEASAWIHELEKEVNEMKNDKGQPPALKNRIKQLEKELRAARSDPIGIADLEHQLLESQAEVIEAKECLLKIEKMLAAPTSLSRTISLEDLACRRSRERFVETAGATYNPYPIGAMRMGAP